MSSLDDLKQQVDRELEAFRVDAQKALKAFNDLEKIISEIHDIKQIYEVNLKGASEMVEGLDRYTENVKTKISSLERDMTSALDRLKNIEAECCQQIIKMQEEMTKLQKDLQNLHNSVNDKIDQNIGTLRELVEQRFSEIDENLQNQATNYSKEIQSLNSRLNDVQNTLISDLESSRHEYSESFTKIDQNIGTLRELVEQRFSEIDENLQNQATNYSKEIQSLNSRLNDVQNTLISDLESSRHEYSESFTKIDQRMNSLECAIMRHHNWLIRMAFGIGLILIGLVGEIVISFVFHIPQ